MASLLGSIIQGVHSAQQYDEAMEEIKKLPDYRDYKPISEMMSMYSQLKSLTQDPFSASSDAAFKSLVSESTSTALNRSVSQDPSLSGVTLAGMNTAGLQQGAMRQMQGDNLRVNYMSQLGNVASMFQEMANMNAQGFNQRLMMREQALGAAASQARQSASEAWVQFGDESEAKTGKIMSMIFGGGMGGGVGQQTPTTNSASNKNLGGSSGGSGPKSTAPQEIPQQGGQNFDTWAYGSGGGYYGFG